VELQWMMLANYAESPNGLLYISGGAWDTINVASPPPQGAPEGVVGAVVGTLVLRFSFHPTELGATYPLRISIVEEDGAEIAHVEGEVSAESQEGAPATWSGGVNVILPLTGLPLPRFGEYRIHCNLNREHKGDLPFRVVRAY
jgi:hypothetical protein